MTARHGRTGLDDEAYRSALVAVLDYLHTEERMTNAKLRALTGLNYDQAVKFFKRATSSGELERRGLASATHYVLRETAP